MAHLLGSQGLHLDFGTGTVLDNVTVGLEDGDRIGVVGANGAGKSSLMSILAGRLKPHEGQVTATRGTTIGYLDQSDALPEGATVASAIVGDADEHEWASDPRVRDVMSGLVPDLDANTKVDHLSGGQRRRVALAHVLVQDHDVIFLDEPTNHLDVEGVAWLAEHVNSRWPGRRGALAVVTHDRWFLDAVTTQTWEVHDGIVDPYEGGYASYVLARVERDRIANATESKRQNLLRKELAWLRRGPPARTTKPKFRIDAANELIADVPPIRDKVQLARMATSRLGKDVVNLVRCSVTYPTPDGGEREVLKKIEWNIGPGERTGILGENGAGKSTLLKLITGELEPTSGHVKTGVTVKVAKLSQSLDELEEFAGERVQAVVKQFNSIQLSDGSELTPGQLLERMGFSTAQLRTQVSRLSGGQKRRLQLLVVLLGEPNVLVLDEPTNDLDTDVLASLEDLLDSWPGTLIVVSHDRYLMERVTDQQYAVIDGGLRHLPGGVDEYVRLSRDRRAKADGIGTFGGRTGSASVPAVPAEAVDTSPRQRQRTRSDGSEPAPQSAAKPAVSGAERRVLDKEVSSLERRLSRLHHDRSKFAAAMVAADPSDHAKLTELGAKDAKTAADIAALEEQWLELTSSLE